MRRTIPRDRFLKALLAVIDAQEEDLDIDEEFGRALLAYGSETEDNVQCVQRVKVGTVPTTSGVGFALRTSNLSVARILNVAEGSPVPDDVLEYYPNITQEDWDAVLRLCTLVFSLCET